MKIFAWVGYGRFMWRKRPEGEYGSNFNKNYFCLKDTSFDSVFYADSKKS